MVPPPEPQLPAAVERSRRQMQLGAEGPRNVGVSSTRGIYAAVGVDNALRHGAMHPDFGIEIGSASPEQIVFDLKGIDVAFANAFRRILIAEVPAVALETIQIWQNTGVVQDEVLSHRLGLIPLAVNPDLLDFRRENEALSEENALRFALRVLCTNDNIDPALQCLPVYGRDLRWVPMSPRQKEKFEAAGPPPAAVQPEMLITKLRPGQEINLLAYAEKGIGKTHAKWSPVCTASYRLMPEFTFPEGPVTGADAVDLKSICPMGVFDIEDGAAVAKYPRNCTTCRICLERFPQEVKIEKNKTHYIFSVESTGAVSAIDLFPKAIAELREKAEKTATALDTAAVSAAAAGAEEGGAD